MDLPIGNTFPCAQWFPVELKVAWSTASMNSCRAHMFIIVMVSGLTVYQEISFSETKWDLPCSIFANNPLSDAVRIASRIDEASHRS